MLGYAGEDKDLILPEKYNGENYEIYKYAFYYRDDITSMVISNAVTSIGYHSFASCRSLTSIKYRGTESQWDAISKGSYWDHDTGAYTITYNYNGN